MANSNIYDATPYNRHTIYKGTDVYDCLACGKMYTSLLIDKHLLQCPKMDEHIARLIESQNSEEYD